MIALTLSLLLSDIRLQGAWDCPDREAVKRELRELGAPAMDGQTAELVQHGDSLELFLMSSGGNILARRVVPSDPHCDRLAKVIAVLLSAWANELSARPPELLGPDGSVGQGGTVATPGGVVPTPSAPGTIISTTGVVQQVSPPPLGAATEPTRVEPTVPTAEQSASRSDGTPARAAEWTVGAGVLGSVTGDGAAIGVLLSGAFQPLGSRWGVHLKAWWATPSNFALGPGEVQWQRFTASLGASYAVPLGAFSIEIQGDAALSWLQTQASGFATNRSPEAIDPGLSLGVVAVWHLRPVEPWLGLWGVVWPFAEHAEVEGTTLSGLIPQFQLLFSLGAALPIL
jgi:hypothetical protein